MAQLVAKKSELIAEQPISVNEISEKVKQKSLQRKRASVYMETVDEMVITLLSNTNS